MGDIGTGLYVSPDVVPVYKDMLRMATIITPNQFEAQYVEPRVLLLTPDYCLA